MIKQNNNNNNNCKNVSSKTICLYMISTTIVSVMVFFVALSYSRSLLRLGELEIDVKEILQVLSRMTPSSCDRKSDDHIGANECNSGSLTQSIECGSCSKAAIESSIKKYTEHLNKEIMATKQQVDKLQEMYKCGKRVKQEPTPVNYALESLGAKIEYVIDIPYYTDNPILTYMGFHFSNSPRQILIESTSPGNCYAFRGTESTVVINLMRLVHIESISIEHILDTMTPSGDISNAPRDFEVYGCTCSSCSKDGKILLGKFTYNTQIREAIQYFKTEKISHSKSYAFVQFQFLTNNGEQSYTCVYRVGVHGRLGKTEKENNNS